MEMEKIHINSSKLSDVIEKFDKPTKIYIPLMDKNGNSYKMLVKVGDYVYKGDKVANCEKFDFPINSSVSGYVASIDTKFISNGNECECIVIENDYKEKVRKNRVIGNKKDNYSKDDFINDLRNSGIVGLGGSGFPSFIKYNTDGIKYLLINAVECEPFISSDKAVIYNYSEDILECIDNILDIMEIDKAIIVIKKSNTRYIDVLNKFIGTYPNISIYSTMDFYPNGWERLVVKNTLGISYDKYPSEKGIIVSNVSTIYAIYEMLKENKSLCERIVTISGNGIKKKCNVKVKVGTLASDIINGFNEYKKIKNPIFIAGGPMMGNSLPSDDMVITADVNSILVISDFDSKLLPCIKCGKCTRVCPSGLAPVLIMTSINDKNKLKCLDTSKCIECGLCSYVCPSKIEVREFVREAKKKVNE